MYEDELTNPKVTRGGTTGLYQELLWLSDYMPADSFMVKAIGCSEDNIKWARRKAREDGFEIAEVSAQDVGDTRNTEQSRWMVVKRPSPKEYEGAEQGLLLDVLSEIDDLAVKLDRLKQTVLVLQG